jgi:hypothetical protein
MGSAFRKLILGCVVTAALSPAVQACINDREVGKAEREFKSSYMGQTPSGEPSPTTGPEQSPTVPMAFLGLGSALVLGAFVVSLNRPGHRG